MQRKATMAHRPAGQVLTELMALAINGSKMAIPT